MVEHLLLQLATEIVANVPLYDTMWYDSIAGAWEWQGLTGLIKYGIYEAYRFIAF